MYRYQLLKKEDKQKVTISKQFYCLSMRKHKRRPQAPSFALISQDKNTHLFQKATSISYLNIFYNSL